MMTSELRSKPASTSQRLIFISASLSANCANSDAFSCALLQLLKTSESHLCTHCK